MTVTAYAARHEVASVALSTPGAPTSSMLTPDQAYVADKTRELAVQEMGTQSLTENNVTVSPPLALAHLDALRPATAGTTARQLKQAFPADARLNAWLHGAAGPVARQLWAQRGLRFAVDYLDQTAQSWAGTPSNWLAGETNFSDQSASADPAFNQALHDTSPLFYTADLSSATHLIVQDSLHRQVFWPSATAFNGVFAGALGRQVLTPMVRITQGVVRYEEPDFVTNAVTVNGTTLMTIIPLSYDVRGFAWSKHLDAAIKNSAAAVFGAPSPGLPPGQIVLPSGSLSMPLSDTLLPRRGATMAYDEIDADLRALDNVGGTYARPIPQRGVMDISSSALTLKFASATQFIYSPKNRQNSGGSTSGVFVTVDTFGRPYPCAGGPDAASMFIVVLDAQQALLSLTAVTQVPGERVHCQ